MFSFGKKVYSGVKQGANYVAVKAQPATNKIKQGAVFMGHQVGGVYSNIKNKITSLNKGQQKEKENVEAKNENENKIENEKKEENEIKEEEKKEEIKNEENNGAGILLNNPSINNEPAQEQKAEQ